MSLPVRRARVLLWVALASVVPARAVSADPCWLPPVAGAVIDPFRAPPCTWCAGNRGLDYRLDGPTIVRAAATGRVEFAGVVGGVRYVVVRLPNGWRHTYGQLSSASLSTGAPLVTGTVVGRAVDRFFFGLRIGDDYADPAPYLGQLVGRRRLVPVDGSPPRAAPPPTLRCGAARSGWPTLAER